jgi:hypothetical protein
MIDLNSNKPLSKPNLKMIPIVASHIGLIDVNDERTLSAAPRKAASSNTCTNCGHFERQADGKVPCGNKASAYYAQKAGFLAISDCGNFAEPKLPEGFTYG